MESKQLLAGLALFVALCVSTSAMGIPSSEHNEIQMEPGDERGVDAGERATWLDTRDIEEEFKELVLLAVQELANEGRIADITSSKDSSMKEKRGRYQGFCFRRTRSGRYLPYICWKGGESHK